MKILAIDTAGPSVSVCVQVDHINRFECVQQNGLTHSQSLMPLIEQGLSVARLALGDLDLIAAVVGPGSFTGVRIGVTTASALGQAANLPCIGINALEAMAAGIVGEGLVCPMQDARAGQVYAAAFQGGWPPARLMEDAACPLTAFLEQVMGLSHSPIFVGDGAVAHQAVWAPACPKARLAPPHALPLRAGAVASLAALYSDRAVPYEQLLPVYLRQPQAERERLAKEAAHG